MPTLKTIKKGEYFKKHLTAKAVLVRGDYDRSSKKYSCHYFDDVNREIFLSGKTIVFTEFEF